MNLGLKWLWISWRIEIQKQVSENCRDKFSSEKQFFVQHCSHTFPPVFCFLLFLNCGRKDLGRLSSIGIFWICRFHWRLCSDISCNVDAHINDHWRMRKLCWTQKTNLKTQNIKSNGKNYAYFKLMWKGAMSVIMRPCVPLWSRLEISDFNCWRKEQHINQHKGIWHLVLSMFVFLGDFVQFYLLPF